MNYYSVRTIAGAVNGIVYGDENLTVSKLATDSRGIFNPEGVLFFAISGPNHDGHNFIERLVSRGVKAFVVSDISYCKPDGGASFILVSNPIAALQQTAIMHRGQFDLPVIGITGSNGKTIVKEWLSHILTPLFSLVKSPKSYNSQIGVPLSVWQIQKQHQLAIFEAGISLPGEMEKLESIIQPEIGIFTNLGNAHQQNFESLRAKASEKSKLFNRSQTLIYCADDETISASMAQFPTKKHLTWSLTGKGNISVSLPTSSDLGSTLQIDYEGSVHTIQTNCHDKASVENAITCLATCLALNIDIHRITDAFLNLPQVAMRFETLDGINDCRIINDAYSLDINSFEIALDTLVHQAVKRKKVVILSDFVQSGLPDKEIYSSVASLLSSHGVDFLIGIGENIGLHRHFFAANSVFFRNTEEFIAGSFMLPLHHAEILVKGARRFGFEKIVSHLEKQTHETVFTINLNAIENNLNYLRAMAGKNVKTMVMVKAFSYGSGYYEIASFMEYLKVDYLAVAYIDEGIDLRRSGISLPIMVMNPRAAALQQMIEYELEPEVFSFDILEEFIIQARSLGRTHYPIHIKLDTGMHRLGFGSDDTTKLQQILQATDTIQLRTLMTHLVASDDPAHDTFTHAQIAKFKSMADKLAVPETLLHVANSAAILRFPEYCFQMVRIGIGLYGFSDNSNLQHSGAMHTVISQLRHVKAGETVGYNRHGKLLRDSVIATIPVGYADGFNRKLGNGNWQVLVNGKKAPVVGDICMDMAMIDVTGVHTSIGDEVLIFGPELSVSKMAEVIGTIPYEVVTSIPQRVKRIYTRE